MARSFEEDFQRWQASKGGIRRRAVEREAVAAPTRKSALAGLLLEKWSWGEISAVQVQKFADAACQDGVTHPDVVALARMGGAGSIHGNVHRDLVRHLPDNSLPNSFAWQVPLLRRKGGNVGVILQEHHFVLPHEWFAALYEHYPARWAAIAGEDNERADFWQAAAARADFANGQICQVPDYRQKMIPLLLHGDGVPVVGVGRPDTKSLDVYSWESLLCRDGSTLDIKIYITSVFSHLLCKQAVDGADSVQELWRVINWSFGALFAGVWPDCGPNGAPFEAGTSGAAKAGLPLAGGFKAVVFGLKGDLDHFSNKYYLEHFGSAKPCFLCRADAADNPNCWANLRPDAPWRTSGWQTDALWREAHAEHHPVFDLPGVTIYSVLLDTLHILDLGVLQYFLGSVFHALVFTILQNGSARANAEFLWGEIRQLYQRHGVTTQFGNFGVNTFCNKKAPHASHPRLRGKAAEVRHLLPLVAELWERFGRRDVEHDQHVRVVLQRLVRLQRILDEEPGCFLPAAAAEEFKTCVDRLVVHCQWLSADARAKGQFLHNLTIKFHMLVHLAEQSLVISPRVGRCYLDEDYVGTMKLVAAASCSGVFIGTISKTVAMKYRTGINIRYCRMPT